MCSIRGTASLLINSYLSNRAQDVVCDDYKSDVSSVKVGVPQGSVSDPLLFIFINDISQPGMKNVLFVDDAVFYAESVNFHQLVDIFR